VKVNHNPQPTIPMPICTIQSTSLSTEIRKELAAQLTDALQSAFQLDGEYQIFFNEYAPNAVSHNGMLAAPFLPIFSAECPPIPVERKEVLVKKITELLKDAYQSPDVMLFFRQYPLENVAKSGLLLSRQRDRIEKETGVHA
jgi:phenylpyruvate tautomerase PptA (4-oxalocrotonate tautomerase family)